MFYRSFALALPDAPKALCLAGWNEPTGHVLQRAVSYRFVLSWPRAKERLFKIMSE